MMKNRKSEINLLEGNIKKELTALAAPLLLGNILQQLYHAADSLIIGRFLGNDAFAAVGVAGALMNLLIFILEGFCNGLSPVFATLYGTGSTRDFRRQVFASLVPGCITSLFLSLVLSLAAVPLLRLMHTPESLIPAASAYLYIIIPGAVIVYLYNLFSCILRSVGNTKASLRFLFLSVIVNTAADYLFVAFLHMGIRGAALATILSQLLAMVCCFFYIARFYGCLLFRKCDIAFERKLFGRTLRYGSASALHASSLYIGKLLVQGSVNTLGTSGIAAYTAASRLEGFANSFGSSGSLSLSIFISQNCGAGQRKRAMQGFRQGLSLQIAAGLLLSAGLFAAADWGSALFLGSGLPSALQSCAVYLKAVALFYALCFTGNALIGYFRGIGCIGIPVIGSILNITTRVVLTHFLISRLGIAAVALATGLGWTAIVCYLLLNARRSKRTTHPL